MCTGTTAAYVLSFSKALRRAYNLCKHIYVLDVVTLAAYGGCGLRLLGQKTTSVDDEYAAHPRS